MINNTFRPYNNETDYPIILEAARKNGISITEVKKALESNNIQWPGLQGTYCSSTPKQTEMDKEILRAWKELGFTN